MDEGLESLNVPAGAIAAILDVDPSRLRQLVKLGFPRTAPGSYPLAACVRWYVNFWRRKADSSSAIEEGRARKIAAEAALAEIELEQKRGAVVSVDIVAATVSEEYANVRARILSLPTKTAPLVATQSRTNECRATLDDAVREILAELSSDDAIATGKRSRKPKCAPGAGAKKRPKAAAASKRKPVGRPRAKTKRGK